MLEHTRVPQCLKWRKQITPLPNYEYHIQLCANIWPPLCLCLKYCLIQVYEKKIDIALTFQGLFLLYFISKCHDIIGPVVLRLLNTTLQCYMYYLYKYGSPYLSHSRCLSWFHVKALRFSNLQSLQQNGAVQTPTMNKLQISPGLAFLHWQSVKSRTGFKTLPLTCKALRGKATKNTLKSVIVLSCLPTTLCSQSTGVVIPRVAKSPAIGRSFHYWDPPVQ